MGYYDALKVFRGLKGKMYYIEPENESYYLDYLLKLEESKIKKILNELNIEVSANKRTLLEEIVPKLGSIMGLEKDFTYEDFVIEILDVADRPLLPALLNTNCKILNGLQLKLR